MMTPKVSAEWLGRVDLNDLHDQIPSVFKATGRSCEIEIINVHNEQEIKFRMMEN